MSYAAEPLLFDKFKGIREYNGVNFGGQISAIEASNIELVQTDIGDCTGIKSSYGNSGKYNLPVGYEIIGIFNSNQEGKDHILIYAEKVTEDGSTKRYIVSD